MNRPNRTDTSNANLGASEPEGRDAEDHAQARSRPSPARILRVVRRGVLITAFAGAAYLLSRFTTFDMPETGCSPIWRLAPGQRLLLDTAASHAGVGDVVIFRTGRETLAIGRIAGEGVASGIGADELWIGTDDPSCPGWDSSVDGAVERADVVGKVLFGM
ncbi:hypothetical protein Pla163_20850 [Planctomycetes bacterium Pla163]|uniref:Peptidase S24-like protein n=1 Tax=Rohdeia mirabilis TaxID=2528008 RepID=A0A518D0J9_9BACT|nr:hypothetical protein Pla163_20850 [Planctomycetes bacterium Pla163]